MWVYVHHLAHSTYDRRVLHLQIDSGRWAGKRARGHSPRARYRRRISERSQLGSEIDAGYRVSV
jgi:hypothetical protein